VRYGDREWHDIGVYVGGGGELVDKGRDGERVFVRS
jgi:hypothetical protein